MKVLRCRRVKENGYAMTGVQRVIAGHFKPLGRVIPRLLVQLQRADNQQCAARDAIEPGRAKAVLSMNRSRFRVRVRFWQKLEAFHEPVVSVVFGGFPWFSGGCVVNG